MVHPLIDSLQLLAHPKGGFYRECYRSGTRVRESDRERSACTLIYYLLEQGQFSSWHRVMNDEIWHLYQGGPLQIYCMNPGLTAVETFTLEQGHDYHCVIPAGHWQAARPLSEFALAGCSVSPGFEFKDFLLLRDHPRKNYVAEQWHDLL